MQRVVITGMGIFSCLGNTREEVTESLRKGRSGISFNEEHREAGMHSWVSGKSQVDFKSLIDRKVLRFMGGASAYSYLAMRDAIEDAGLTPTMVSNERTGLLLSSGGSSTEDVVEAADLMREKGLRRVGAYRVTRSMSSTVSACLATAFAIKGMSYSITSACSTSSHCIGAAMEQIQMGKQDVVFAGGGESDHWSMACLFDAMGALSTNFNDTPERASRPYDRDRDGFVIAAGGGVVVVEALEHALARNAKIYAELTGYGATSDGHDMVLPSGEGAERCMRLALATAGTDSVDYINAHGTSTPQGDLIELKAIQAVFGDSPPPVSSTKSLSGHSLGATGVHETIYSLLMMEEGFIAASANVENLDEGAKDLPIVTQRRDGVNLERVLSNSFGFGGTNACLIFQKYDSTA